MKNLDLAAGQGYDVIGDIHGYADALRRLLIKLGYTEVDGAFRHESRKAIFVGDFVDRGPEQREVLRIARAMCEAETAFALLGNSFNWQTNGFIFNLTLQTNFNYRIQATTNLSTNPIPWVDLTNFTANNSSLLFTDRTATNYRLRFYRVASP